MAFETDRDAVYYDAFVDPAVYVRDAAALRARHPHAVTVLEIGAGTGMMTRELERQGFLVTPLEPSEAMARHFKAAAPLVQSTIQDFEPGCQFDLVVAYCDVLNYVPFDQIDAVIAKMCRLCRNGSAGMMVRTWDAAKGVTPFRYRVRQQVDKKLHQVRLGYSLLGRAHMFFIHWGRGLRLSYHRLYLHK
jgi:2-polyprenyl-3-methyl-5-hydroxy-6-metoxy-1,4-benzoquinol methylase